MTRARNVRSIPTLTLFLQCVLLCGRAVQAAPAVSSFSPATGKPGIQVTINGAGFSTATQLKFDTTPADFTVVSDARIVATVPVDATTGPVGVTNPSGDGVSGASFVVEPRLTSFSPSRGAINTPVSLQGFNFVGATNVLFDNKPAAFTVTALTQIQAMVPAGATNGPITVQTPAGAVTSSNDFFVIGPGPIVDDFSPNIGAPGSRIIIFGANFGNPLTVKFNGVADSTAVATTPSQISATVPSGATTGKISVTTSAGTATSTNNFTVTNVPVVTDFFPKRGQTNFTQVTIQGINFDIAPITGVGFNGRPVFFISHTAQNQITVTVPPDATTGRITVTNASGFGTSSNDFVITSAPIIDWFAPITGKAGDPVTIGGVNLSNGPTVLNFNGANAAFVVTGQGGTIVQATLPNGAATGPITMTNAYGSFATSSNFFVTGSAPYVTSLTPDNGPRGATIFVNGGNFSNPVTVKFNGVSSPSATATTLSQIQAAVPANATTGPVTVTTASGTSTNNVTFYLPPRLSGFSPMSGIVGSSVVITGANFTSANSVLFNTAAADFAVTASNSISATIPTNALTGPLTVTTPGGVIIGTNNFRVQPNITDFTPILGPVGTPVAILGTSFVNVTNVSFNNVSAPGFAVISSTEIHATVPSGTATGPIRVSTPDGVAASAMNFLVTKSSDLTLQMSASTNLAKPGEQLTYSLTVTNNGPSVVTGVTLTNRLPDGVNFVSATSTTGACTQTNGVVTCAPGILTNNTGFAVTIVVVPPVEAVLNNSATVRSVESDLNPGDNSAFVLTPVVSDSSRTLRIDRLSGPERAVISWPVSVVTFSLQSVGALTLSNNVWQPVTNAPAVSNFRYVVTNNILGGKKFYRLKGP